MYFEELSIEEKVEVTLNEFKRRDDLISKGRKEAAQYSFNNSCKIRKRLKGERKASIKD